MRAFVVVSCLIAAMNIVHAAPVYTIASSSATDSPTPTQSQSANDLEIGPANSMIPQTPSGIQLTDDETTILEGFGIGAGVLAGAGLTWKFVKWYRRSRALVQMKAIEAATDKEDKEGVKRMAKFMRDLEATDPNSAYQFTGVVEDAKVAGGCKFSKTWKRDAASICDIDTDWYKSKDFKITENVPDVPPPIDSEHGAIKFEDLLNKDPVADPKLPLSLNVDALDKSFEEKLEKEVAAGSKNAAADLAAALGKFARTGPRSLKQG